MVIDLAADRIGTLRAIGRTDDQLALRLALGRTLDRVSLRPSCVPPGAIVCVRYMRIAHAPRPEQWTMAIGERMEALVRDAVRPFRAAVPADAPAVLFVDEAELLACLARDWSRGAGRAWWWRSVFGEALSDALVRRTLLSSATLVPVVVGRLAGAQCLTPIVRAMPDAFCEQLGAAVASTFAVPEWTRTATTAVPDRFALMTTPPAAGTRSTVERRITAALRQYSSVDLTVLPPAQRALVGLSLLITAAPAVARSPGVIALLRSNDAWWSSADGAANVAAVRRQTPQSDVLLRTPAASNSITTERAHLAAREDAPVLASAPAPLAPLHPELATDGEDAPSSTERGLVSAAAPAQDLRQSLAAVDFVAHIDPMDDDLSPMHIVHSEFAGIVYVVNLALHLELYGDFTQPARPGLELAVGDFLALVGARVFGNAFMADPVWHLLAELAGREPFEPPGSELNLNPRASFESGPGDQPDLPLRVAEWTSRLVECAASVLGMEWSSALPFLCARAGRLALSATRLDATFELAAHPLAIRMACLDRDPGWVPAAGRIIAFHYD